MYALGSLYSDEGVAAMPLKGTTDATHTRIRTSITSDTPSDTPSDTTTDTDTTTIDTNSNTNSNTNSSNTITQQLQVASRLSTPIFPSSAATTKSLQGSNMNTASITAFFANPWSSISTIGSSVSPRVDKMVHMGGSNSWTARDHHHQSSALEQQQQQTPAAAAAAIDRHPPSASPTAAASISTEARASLELQTEAAVYAASLRSHEALVSPTTIAVNTAMPIAQVLSRSTGVGSVSAPSDYSYDEPSDTESNITFYQGFRASHPRLSKPRPQSLQPPRKGSPTRALLSLGQLMFSSAPIAKPKPSIMPSSSTTASGSSLVRHAPSKPDESRPLARSLLPAPVPAQQLQQQQHPLLPFTKSPMPEKARHQAFALHNITRIFSELLSERDALIIEADELEDKRNELDAELQSVEAQLAVLTATKRELSDVLRGVVQRELKISEMVDSLDDRISSIGDQTIKVEKTIRNIRDDSMLLLERLEADIPPNSCIKMLTGHEDAIQCLHFENPRGLLVSGSADKTIRVWDLSTYRCVSVLSGHTGWVRDVQIRGTTVMSGSSDHTIRQWNVSSTTVANAPSDSDVLHSARGHKRTLLVKAAGDSTSSYADSDDHDDHHDDQYNSDVSLSGPHVCTYSGHTGGVTSIMFDDTNLFSGSMDTTIRQWDLRTGSAMQVLSVHSADGDSSDRLDASLATRSTFDFGDEGHVTGSSGGGVGWQANYFNYSKSSSSVQSRFSATHSAALAEGGNGRRGGAAAVPYSALFGQPEFEGWTQIDTKAVVVPDLPDVYSPGFDFYSSMMDTSMSTLQAGGSRDAWGESTVSEPYYHGGVAANVSGATLSRASLATTAHSTSSTVQHSSNVAGGAVGSVYFQKQMLVSGHGDGIVRIWDLRTGNHTPHLELKAHVGNVTSVCFDDLQVFSGGADQTLKIWDMRSGALVEDLQVGGAVSGLSCDLSRVSVAAAGISDVLVYYRGGADMGAIGNIGSTMPFRRLSGHTRPVNAVGHAGDTLVSGGLDAAVGVWRVGF
ncbi:hypothetical protein BASA83_010515 [Batrachochytrium salamandrivorans]|nr:hypothetical protein BASA62_006557 [Batrachochytrium salamandrivorans]KAH9266531.1 hypothetical protein BASA83_010515 [Batrachochytrium salamandrivorans]